MNEKKKPSKNFQSSKERRNGRLSGLTRQHFSKFDKFSTRLLTIMRNWASSFEEFKGCGGFLDFARLKIDIEEQYDLMEKVLEKRTRQKLKATYSIIKKMTDFYCDISEKTRTHTAVSGAEAIKLGLTTMAIAKQNKFFDEKRLPYFNKYHKGFYLMEREVIESLENLRKEFIGFGSLEGIAWHGNTGELVEIMLLLQKKGMIFPEAKSVAQLCLHLERVFVRPDGSRLSHIRVQYARQKSDLATSKWQLNKNPKTL